MTCFFGIENEETWARFHKPNGAKHKCQKQSIFSAIQFHQQNYTQLYHYPQLEITLNFYAVC